MAADDHTDPSLSIRLFGPLEARVNGEPLPPLRTHKGEWLLALLTLRAGGHVERSWLAGTLWPASGERQAMASLRRCLTDLRRALGPAAGRLSSPTPQTLCLSLEGAEADVHAFDAAVAQSDEALLERGVALYRGPFLEGCAEAWAFQERQAREQAYLQALERLAERALGRGDLVAAERRLREVVAVDPLRESAQRTLMETLAAGGNYAAALLLYRELRLHLNRELHAAPDPETQALFQQIQVEARQKAALGSGLCALGKGGSSPLGDRSAAVPTQSPEPRAQSQSEATLTFLFTDIEGSTRLWEEQPEAMREALTRHDALLRGAIEGHGGTIFKTWGDQFCAAFATAPAALMAALAGQRALSGLLIDDCRLRIEGTVLSPNQQSAISNQQFLKVRMALHTGTAQERDGDYFGAHVNRVARLLDAGHGGQILLSQATGELVRDTLPEGASLRDLGEHRLRDLARAERIFQLTVPDLPADFPPLRSLENLPNNLPRALTSFVGREREIATVKERLLDTALLTLTGAGGCGKTRLALQVAADLVREYPDGVWLVELAALFDPDLVPQSVASVLGVREVPGRALIETLIDHLRPGQRLLVLDNCEHLVGACASLCETLLRACPRLQILATSREALGLAGEGLYRVPSLSLPDPQEPVPWERLADCEAVRLFIDRAAAIQPTFAVTKENGSGLVEICRRLDGLPLAIELAAARVRALTVEGIRARLDDRFRLLTGGSRTALSRQKTLQGTIDWSYDLLTEGERALLRRLSVFAGGWTLEAAEAVCAEVMSDECRVMSEEAASFPAHHSSLITHHSDVLDLLTSLVEKSLVVYQEQDGQARYRLLETVRQYGRDRLLEAGEVDALQRRHRDWFLALAEQSDLGGDLEAEWLAQLERDHDNLRAALDDYLEAGEAEAGLRLGGALWEFWYIRGYLAEGRERLVKLLALPGGEARSGARAWALHGAGVMAHQQGDYVVARRLHEESLSIQRELGNRMYTAFSLNNLGNIAHDQGDYATARKLLDESLAIKRELGEPSAVAATLNNLGSVAHDQGDYAAARRLCEESLGLRRELGNRLGIAYSLNNLGNIVHSQGDYAAARRLHEESLVIKRDLGDRQGIAESLGAFAALAVVEGRPERMARLLGAAEALREALQAPLPPKDRERMEHNVTVARRTLGEEAFRAAWEAGRAKPLDEAIRVALEEAADA